MANENMPGEGIEPEKKLSDVEVETKLSLGTKVTLTAIVVGTVAAGVYLALTLSR
ncbi:MAG: hypothetical protein V1668_04970 [Patescibacteria group bacterium]